MNLLVPIPDGVGFYKRKNGRGLFHRFGKTKKISTMVYRIARLDHDTGPLRILADVWVPEHHRGGFIPGDLSWIGDGIYRTHVYFEDNRNSLRAFIESGDREWDVREVA
ncbi:hypothetical protein [Paraburkholderia sp. BCC1884]|uniref:hypothetical protein n=1 Tax=Paraburkholderia sp. BCC1884 TaxID=2562668 RepID=UPI0011839708|nr:hypothetical protein [Paraburkholderia sp. BCC1884]